jgi:uncharacterized protein YlxW (UPF0749 family)
MKFFAALTGLALSLALTSCNRDSGSQAREIERLQMDIDDLNSRVSELQKRLEQYRVATNSALLESDDNATLIAE